MHQRRAACAHCDDPSQTQRNRDPARKTPCRHHSRYLAYADLGSKAALLDTETHVFNDANFVSTWHRLLPADRELLRLIVSGVTDIFSESSRGRLGAALGLNEAVAKNVPQQSLRRLQDTDLVLRMDYGDYRVHDDALTQNGLTA